MRMLLAVRERVGLGGVPLVGAAVAAWCRCVCALYVDDVCVCCFESVNVNV